MNELVGRAVLEVPFHDVDALRIVWHGHYLKYFEIARTDLFRAAGIEVTELDARAVYFVVVESRCRHTRPLTYGDRVEVEARVLPNQTLTTIVYRVRNVSRGEIAARGRTTLAPVDPRTGAMIELPDDLRQRLHA